jgi:cell shape-determining protein MreC
LDNLSSSDKKKRNTAASARFRIKKKLREEEMERTLKDLNERVSKYNSRIQQLEMENKCLKSLILQKNEQRSNDLLRSIKERSMNSQL